MENCNSTFLARTCFTRLVMAFLFFLLSCTPAIAQTKGYWHLAIPIMEGAENISATRNETFVTVTTDYQIQLSDLASIYAFYNNYFEPLGWQNPLQDSVRMQLEQDELVLMGGWNGQRVEMTQDGKPELIYTAVWAAKDVPAIATLMVTVAAYVDDVFAAQVKLSLSPRLETQALFGLQQLVLKDPKNLFKLYEAVGGDPFELDKLQLQALDEKGRTDPLIAEYLSIVDAILAEFKHFHQTYNQ